MFLIIKLFFFIGRTLNKSKTVYLNLSFCFQQLVIKYIKAISYLPYAIVIYSMYIKQTTKQITFI